ncbi:TPA: acyltransferase [Yersinia enterocolitica]|uniref:acyltransferase family protein n=1 Tax=Yersinia enterocolitica TaxID=630 RepID=UPI0005DB1BB2|nr:acyltransferase [Yersinia enterocolitica]CNF83481.1 Acyltransferase family [Yersinia enterocolitica]HDL6967035.1 acyltransferase [Yersinia enterocolitica]HDL6975122.1 acyltransferase [Yersinia enterocolitica]HDL6996422.1 acyltransferase [Yersinia enterocolitica]HDL7095409.1 acyltransferase [Yersinia enterocolitica]
MIKSKIDIIQALRAIAALLVVMHHYPGRISIFSSGYIGVDLFFIISGFIMVITTHDRDLNKIFAAKFLINRFSRIWPYYILITAITLLVVYLPAGLVNYSDISLYLKSIFLVPMWTMQPIVKPGWTLSLEMYFYFIFFISLTFGRFRWRFIFSYFIFTLGILYFIKGYDVEPLVNMHNVFIDYYIMITRQISWCFIFGIIIAMLYLKSLFINLPASISLFIVSLSVTIYLALNYTIDHGPLYGVLLSLIMYSLLSINSNRKITIPTWITFLGDISFSIYLIQFIVISLLEQHVLYMFSSSTGKYLMVFPYLSLIISISYFSYKYFEVTLDSSCKKKLIKILLKENFSLKKTDRSPS